MIANLQKFTREGHTIQHCIIQVKGSTVSTAVTGIHGEHCEWQIASVLLKDDRLEQTRSPPSFEGWHRFLLRSSDSER